MPKMTLKVILSYLDKTIKECELYGRGAEKIQEIIKIRDMILQTPEGKKNA